MGGIIHFENLKKGFERLGNGYGFCADVGGKVLRLSFQSEEAADVARRRFANVVMKPSDIDAHFYFWADDCSRYTGEELPSWKSRYVAEGGWAMTNKGSYLMAADMENRFYYYIHHDAAGRGIIPDWALECFVVLWACSAGFVAVRGTVVGMGDRGVILSSLNDDRLSGVVGSCVSSGIDIMSEDYVLVDKEGTVKGFPIFATHYNEPNIKAVVFIGDEHPVPEIVRASGHSAVRLSMPLTRCMQQWDICEPLLTDVLIQRFIDFPAYELHPGADHTHDADMLRTFIEEL